MQLETLGLHVSNKVLLLFKKILNNMLHFIKVLLNFFLQTTKNYHYITKQKLCIYYKNYIYKNKQLTSLIMITL